VGVAAVQTLAGVENPSVELNSFLDGVVIQEQERGIAARALAVQTADMETYIARKQQVDLASHFDRIFTLTIPVA
jgi:peptidoglycan hydrolase-like amidase